MLIDDKDKRRRIATDEAANMVKRRQFVKQAAVLGATLAAADALSPLTPTSASAQTVPDRWDEETDVIIVGTGAAGYTAAIEAKDAGASVVMIEKARTFGGRAIHSNGDCQLPVSHMQKKAGIEDRVEWAFEDYFTNGEHRAVPEVLRVFVEGAADTALWLEKLGIVWSTPHLQMPDCRVPRTLSPVTSPNYKGSAGISIIDVLNQQTVKRQIPIKLEHRLTAILRPDPKGPVLGIQATHAGKTLNFKARRGVILATGGYNANHRMLRAANPLLDESWNWAGGPYTQNTGDAHVLSMQVGAGFADGSFTPSLWFVFGSPQIFVWDPPTPESPFIRGGIGFPSRNRSAILVENDGKRFVDESTWGTGDSEVSSPWVNAVLRLPKRPRNVWAVADSVGAGEIGWKHAQFVDPAAQKNPYLDPTRLATADTLEELAAKMGIPAEGLKATLSKYNLRVDEEFGRPVPYTPIVKPPFYAAKMAPLFADQSSGMRVNTKMQIIDQASLMVETGASESVPIDKEAVIPRLYGAGEFTGGSFGASRGHGKLGSYMVQGRVAGKAAAAEKPWGS
jgi:urocanate reductase